MWKRITVPRLPEPGDHRLIDDVSRISGGTATIFTYDPAKDDFIRITTSVKKPDGTRAVGTPLGQQSAAYAPLKQGRIFRGKRISSAPPITPSMCRSSTRRRRSSACSMAA